MPSTSACVAFGAAIGFSAAALGQVPLNDLGSGTYLNQYQGGLYPGGVNTMPPAQLAAAMLRAGNVQPLNTSGQPDPNGRFVLMSVGMSNTSQEWCGNDQSLVAQPYSLMGQAAVHPAVDHSRMVIFNGARGGQTASTWDNTTDANYARVQTDLTNAGLSQLQVRAAWLKVANASPTASLPAANSDANTLVQQMGNIVRTMKQRYTNLDMVFVSSRIYAGYATSSLNPEPYAYESGLAVKRLIEAQITQMNGGGIDPLAGDLSFGPGGPAPLLAWGPYLWANGATPRSDGLTWVPSDFASDGTHPSAPQGRKKVADALLRYFINTPHTKDWFLQFKQGDADTNGIIDFDDYSRIDNGFNNHLTGWTNGDFDANGIVDFDDYALIDSNFNLQSAPGAGTPVPEPATLLSLAMLITLKRPRQRRN